MSYLVFDVYPDSTVIYPGHGDDTTLGAERPPWPNGANAVGDPVKPNLTFWNRQDNLDA